jgi:hypothetical protein
MRQMFCREQMMVVALPSENNSAEVTPDLAEILRK